MAELTGKAKRCAVVRIGSKGEEWRVDGERNEDGNERERRKKKKRKRKESENIQSVVRRGGIKKIKKGRVGKDSA